MHVDAGALLRELNATGHLQVNRTLFPSGIPALSAWLRQRQVKLGVYTDIGNKSCGPGPGSYGFYRKDAVIGISKIKIKSTRGNLTFVHTRVPAAGRGS